MKKIITLLKPHEVSLLDSFLEVFPQKAKADFLDQLDKVKIIQREPKGMAVNFYGRKFLRTEPLDCDAFLGFPEERLAATFTPEHPVESKMKGKFWFVFGRPFSIEYEGVETIEDIKSWRCELDDHFKKLMRGI